MESWSLFEPRIRNGRRKSLSGLGWLLGAALVLAVPACGDSGTKPRDAALNRDAPPTPLLDSASVVTDDVAPARDASPLDLAAKEVGSVDVSSTDLPLARDLAAVSDAPLGSEAGGRDAPSVLPLDGVPDRGADSQDTARSSDSSGGEAGARALDTGLETGLSFCAAQDRVDAGASQRLCYDFSDSASAADFVPEGGTWLVTNGSYTAVGPAKQTTCPNGNGSLMTESVLASVTARDLRVHARMTAISSPDKVIVLRSRPGGNRIELNFRANFVFDGIAQGGDLYISALIDCQQVTYVPVATILIPHDIGQNLVADVELIGRHLAVAVDGKTVFDDTLPLPNDAGTVSFPTDPGKVGFAVFQEAVTEYDDFLVEVLD